MVGEPSVGGGRLVSRLSFKLALVSTGVLVRQVYIRSTRRRSRVGSLRVGWLSGMAL